MKYNYKYFQKEGIFYMINLSVINLRNLIKNILKFALVLALIIGIMNIGDLVIVREQKF
jgi:hypothetical protein